MTPTPDQIEAFQHPIAFCLLMMLLFMSLGAYLHHLLTEWRIVRLQRRIEMQRFEILRLAPGKAER